MQNRGRDRRQMQLFDGLEKMLNPKEPLYKLEKVIPWEELEEEFSRYYTNFGRPAKPTRLMISLLLLKQLHNISDDEVVSQWTHNPYWQYLSGEEQFKWELPCTSSELTHFRKRIGKAGVERIFRLSVGVIEGPYRSFYLHSGGGIIHEDIRGQLKHNGNLRLSQGDWYENLSGKHLKKH